MGAGGWAADRLRRALLGALPSGRMQPADGSASDHVRVDIGSDDPATTELTVGGTMDGGTMDGGSMDGGTMDGGSMDGGPMDSGPRDGGPRDAGAALSAVDLAGSVAVGLMGKDAPEEPIVIADVSVTAAAIGELTPVDLADVRQRLSAEVDSLRHELASLRSDIDGLLADSAGGSGDDQADSGAKTFEREHEMVLTANALDLLEQTEHALDRIEGGIYGICEGCGQSIARRRLLAFPRATLCLDCKQRQERG